MSAAEHNIRALRLKAANAKLNRDEAVWFLARAKARAIAEYIERVGDWKLLGSNDQQRAVTETEILAESHAYTTARADLREAELEVARCEADIEAYTETRRLERESLQRRYIEGMEDAMKAEMLPDVRP